MEIRKCILINNECYLVGKKIVPKGIVVHSTGCNNPYLKRYLQPDDGILGLNTNGTDWNRSGIEKCVHAWIGKDKNGDVRTYQSLPWTFRSWGCGKGPKGSFNDTHIQFEICEDALKDEKYFNEAFEQAAELCAYFCKTFNIKVENIVSHAEAHALGYASDHMDCNHWLIKFNKNMFWFRKKVESLLETKEEPKTEGNDYKVKITANELNVRKGPGTSYSVGTVVKNGEVFTIVDETMNGSTKWGKLKSGAGWISLKFTTKI